MSQNSKLYVGNLSYSVDEESLGDLFAEVGEVISVKVIKDKETGQSKGFAFVEMASEQDARNAIEKLNHTEFSGRALNVSEARPQEPRSGGFGGGNDRGGYDRDRGGSNRRGGGGGRY